MSKKRRLNIIFILIAIGFFSWLIPKIRYVYCSFQKSTNPVQVTVYLSLKNGPLNVKKISHYLKEKGVLTTTNQFELVGEQKGMNARNIAAGKYLILPGTTFANLWDSFSKNSRGSGNAEKKVNVNFSNCRTINEMAGRLQNQLDMDSLAFIQYVLNPQVLSNLNVTKEQLPALFIPNKYQMYWDQTPSEFIEFMSHQYNEFWNADRRKKLEIIGFTDPSQAVTLASIVYCEQTRKSAEWPIIAGLYLNRLKQGIRLQSDPTFKFCWGDELRGVQRLLYVHRDIDCPYNTYKIKGLPPGPIFFPPPEVVDAVLNPDQNNYIFMCAKPDHSRTHNFTDSGKQHSKNAKAFQQWLAAGQP